MVNSCSAFGCRERYVKGTDLSFHSFPTDEVRRNIWTLALRRKDFKPTIHSKLCSKHFSPDCFDTEAFGFGRKLKRDAVPSIFNFAPHLASQGRNAKKVWPPSESEMYTILKRRRIPRKSCICDYHKEVDKNSIENTKQKKRLCRQKSQHAVKKGHTAETLHTDFKQKQIVTKSLADMLEVDLHPHFFILKVNQEPENSENEEVDLHPHLFSVDVKQEPEDSENEEVYLHPHLFGVNVKQEDTENEEVDVHPHFFSVSVKQEPKDSENEEFVEDPPATTRWSVNIKEDPELELGVNVIENGVLREPFQTSACIDNIKEEPEAVEVENNVDAFARSFVPESCLSNIKKEKYTLIKEGEMCC